MKTYQSLIYRRFLISIILKKSQGFTLIELMVVVMMMGVLAAISLPNMIAQVGKAREAEAKELLSSIGFAQQGHFFEYRQFASAYIDMGLTFNSKYYDISEPQSTSTTTYTTSEAVAKSGVSARSYGLGIYYIDSSYQINLCQSSNPTTTTQAPDSLTGSCSNGGEKIN
jgi:type IV pilus assembly protein PilA